ncbi:MAG: trehalose-phosphatase, trehalose 6-phosphate phosphatase [Chloroflexi bacterium CSP1-4]|nr:MAG: trehalose-phosphatase, trehalose 6-phosphate phosphatase [Chloroflexi bacterium CSP1-4]
MTVPGAVSWRAALALAAPDLRRRPCLVITDFDGTISRIGLDPWGARPEPLAQRALRRLAATPGVEVVLLSGRTAPDLAGRVRVGGATYLGNHGLEHGFLPRGARAESLVVVADPTHDGFSADAERLAMEVPAAIGEPWLIVERKPPAVTFWFRTAPDIAAAARQVRAVVDRLDPNERFERFPLRRALELRPPGATAKRDAFATLLRERRPALVVLIGDDRSDAEAFAVLRVARDARDLTGLAVAVHTHPDVSPAVAAEADAMLASPRETARFLSGLARGLARAAAPGRRPGRSG